MTDFFVLLMLAGAGDQLQGIKRGIMEMCDAMVITKADGSNVSHANRAKAEYASALHLFPARDDGWFPPIITTSALERQGLDDVMNVMHEFVQWMQQRGLFDERRNKQNLSWLHETVRMGIIERYYHDSTIMEQVKRMEAEVTAGKVSPFQAAAELLKNLK